MAGGAQSSRHGDGADVLTSWARWGVSTCRRVNSIPPRPLHGRCSCRSMVSWGMPQRDARSRPAAAREGKRRPAVRLRQEGRTFAEIGASGGVHRARVSGWWKRFEADGPGALAARRRGRRLGRHRRLTLAP
ncbi:MAG: helix-turn-helix domain-containing protein, partial [Dehalococcoidia bacterium]